jgi:alpha-amylase/alpha-mannosidase (GH57 family)
MKKVVNFVLGLHNHQPVGNLGFVFVEAYDKAYKPFLDILERHPKIRVSLHYTGPLFQWLVENRPELVARLKALVDKGQVEMMTGGYYEPIMPVIPERDRIEQIRLLTDYTKKHTGYDAAGMWLAERVWEPQLTSSLAKAGVKYIVLDDSHFKATGIEEARTYGYYCTEDQGETMAAFPISEKLRYLIPFEKPEKTIEFLKTLATEDGQTTVVMADDGEKFGVWPKTYDHCYRDGWLEAFFNALEANADWINITTFSDVMANTPPIGRTYLPTASYVEMMEWAMPAKSILGFESFLERLKKDGLYEGNKTFVRGGFWRNFFSKYDESNHMHKRMLHVSKRLERLESEHGAKKGAALREARDHMMAGQCNCAYWHGVFGGLYLSNLRHGIYENLVAADAKLDAIEHGAGKPFVSVQETDFLADMKTEVIVATDRQTIIVKPDQGGQIIEHDWKPRSLNITNTLTRRFEAYHKNVSKAISPEEAAKSDGTASIHDIVIAKEQNLDKLLNYDWYRRSSFVDHFFGPEATIDNFRAAQYPEQGNFVNQPYQWRVEREGKGAEEEVSVVLTRDGYLFPQGGPRRLRVEKTLRLAAGGDALRVDYALTNTDSAPISTRFAIEYVANLLAGDAHDRYYIGIDPAVQSNKLKDGGVQSGVSEFGAVDEWMNVRLQFGISKATDVWRVPVETVSLSEAGFERSYQGTAFVPVWNVALEPGKTWSVSIELAMSGAREMAAV